MRGPAKSFGPRGEVWGKGCRPAGTRSRSQLEVWTEAGGLPEQGGAHAGGGWGAVGVLRKLAVGAARRTLTTPLQVS